jgi:predicted DNA-binding transcriptional regulator YafY
MTRVPAEKRLERLLVMVPWIMQNEGPTVDEVCQRFDTNEQDLARDLEMLFYCGLYPFTPDTLIEADIVDGRVWIRSADQFQRPPRFTAEEALALVAAASTVAELAGNEDNVTLRSALGKLSRVLGLDSEDSVAIELAPATPQTLGIVQEAARLHRVLEVDYYSYGRDVWSRRRIEPYQVFNQQGQWYVQAQAQEIGELRNFRIDRMRNAVLTDASFTAPLDKPEPRVYQARDDDPVAVVELESQAEWILDKYPVDSVEKLDNGKTRVTMRISEKLWFERLLLRLGPYATVIAGDVGIETTARQILRRYEGRSEDS